MNFDFRIGDIVEFRYGLEPAGTPMELVKEFVEGIFHARTADGRLFRVRSAQLVRICRLSDEIRRNEIEARKAVRAKEVERKRALVRSNMRKYRKVEEYRIPLTALGLPDKRYKPKYTAKNNPELKIRPRTR